MKKDRQNMTPATTESHPRTEPGATRKQGDELFFRTEASKIDKGVPPTQHKQNVRNKSDVQKKASEKTGATA